MVTMRDEVDTAVGGLAEQEEVDSIVNKPWWEQWRRKSGWEQREWVSDGKLEGKSQRRCGEGL